MEYLYRWKHVKQLGFGYVKKKKKKTISYIIKALISLECPCYFHFTCGEEQIRQDMSE